MNEKHVVHRVPIRRGKQHFGKDRVWNELESMFVVSAKNLPKMLRVTLNSYTPKGKMGKERWVMEGERSVQCAEPCRAVQCCAVPAEVQCVGLIHILTHNWANRLKKSVAEQYTALCSYGPSLNSSSTVQYDTAPVQYNTAPMQYDTAPVQYNTAPVDRADAEVSAPHLPNFRWLKPHTALLPWAVAR